MPMRGDVHLSAMKLPDESGTVGQAFLKFIRAAKYDFPLMHGFFLSLGWVGAFEALRTVKSDPFAKAYTPNTSLRQKQKAAITRTRKINFDLRQLL